MFRFERLLSVRTMYVVTLFWLSVLILVWYIKPFSGIPTPTEIISTYPRLINSGLLQNVYVTLKLNIIGTMIASVLSAIVAYLYLIPELYPVNKAFQILRFIPIIGFNLVFLHIFSIGFSMKLAMLVTGISFFLVKAMTDEIGRIPNIKIELCKVLGYKGFGLFRRAYLNPLKPVFINTIGQNCPMAWIMITSIETMNRTEGGIGAQIYSYSATGQLPEVYAYLLIIGLIAILQDISFNFITKFLYPYTTIQAKG